MTTSSRRSPPRHPATEAGVTGALRALGGRATRGDLVLATGYSLARIDDALHSLMAAGTVEVTVTNPAVVVYRLQAEASASGAARPPMGNGPVAWASRVFSLVAPREELAPFDRKTLRLIRARDGVVSIAELVEHTGLTVEAARAEAERLMDLYGGDAYPSWDGHVVYAFPQLVSSAHGAFSVREPRPAWVRGTEPVRAPGRRRSLGRASLLAGAAVALGWFATNPPGAGGRVILLAAVAGASAGAAFLVLDLATRALGRIPAVRLRQDATLRRYLLGLVFETALRGKGVVSSDRAGAYLESRTGVRPHRRRVVRVLRSLAAEFDAPELELDGDRLFGFRNVKRQFLASHVQRRRLGLAARAAGTPVFDSGDSDVTAAERELELFDADLLADAISNGGSSPGSMEPLHR